ncbi:fluoroquinolone export ABC transporter permease subunit [Candidatus Contubernalis alkaliaceticus]|uniref:fluoroquinolone export ABC transporter permease subunit n=1 Tax=Candidatus Contubernalis alkaliaceticus TaxID=338645 RepID=UPI001F4BDF92|nr:ABC transporter permease [Candidatus Contubernalis alkalaceticus]UNC91034.1 ABC transporter permease [Candidatus Contubernalis alkalaceticus]
MDRLIPLVKGEFDRLNKYNLFTANFVVLLLWVGLAWFFDGEELKMFLPVIFLMDATMMTMLMVGATLFYEKQEHTLNSIMVSPVSEEEYLMTKIIVNIINSLISVVFISAAVFFVKGVTYNYFLLVPAVIVITVVHTLIGIRISYNANTFTSMLVNFIVYIFLFLFPSLFAMLDIIGPEVAKLLIILPPETSRILISTIVQEVEPWKLVFGYGYLVALTYIFYRFIVKPKFNDFIMRETGV